ncbi:MAG: hypothetical protein M1836_003923 [Candelina mexicana]|nr:MAG: hypothetical protein M1836_003923 [Candelina mexicana]
MRLLLQAVLGLCALLTTAKSLSLANFEDLVQQVPKHCNDTWNTQIYDCTSSDFQTGGSCSSKCIDSIQNVARTVNIECQGVVVEGNKLMGLFFEGRGLTALCPNMVVTSLLGGGSGNGAVTTTKGTSAAAASSLPSGSTEIVYDTTALLATKSSQSAPASSLSGPPSKPTIPASTKAASISTTTLLTSSVKVTTSITITVLTTTSSTTSSKGSTTTAVASTASTAIVTSATPVVSVTTTSSRGVRPLPTIDPSGGGNRDAQTHEANPQITGGGGSPFEVSNDGRATTVPWRIPHVLWTLLVLLLSS